jgi:hypothetical protein
MSSGDSDAAGCCGCIMVVGAILVVILLGLACAWLALHL